METKYKIIPFDIKKAKTPENPDGFEVVTKDGKNVRIVCTNKRGDNPIVTLIENGNLKEDCVLYNLNGVYWSNDSHNLALKEPVQYRRMTNQELSKWLREKPEEFREAMINHNLIKSIHSYFEECKNLEVGPDTIIRSNYGEWKEPLIEE